MNCFENEQMWRMLRGLLFSIGLGIALYLTYNQCVKCVIVIAIISGLTMTCIPTMPIVFLISCTVLILHLIDYHSATVKVEIPLENFVYIPSWDDVNKYVHMDIPKSLNEGGSNSDSSMKSNLGTV